MDTNTPTQAPASQAPAPKKPYRYTMGWLGTHTLFALVMAGVFSIAANGIDSLGAHRAGAKLLSAASRSLLSESTFYSFAVIAISTVSLMLIEVAFRKKINYLQYGLIGCALCLFYLLLLSMAELLPFVAAYVVVSVMTVGLIGFFVKGLTGNMKAVAMTAGILAAEYGVILLLLYLGSMALLVGSLVLFALIALAMYFTLKLKLVDEELTLN